ncbi:hypothetical protein Tco_1157936, partial [Tanacetum coccineum]
KRGAESTIVKKSRDGASGASTAAKCSLPQKRPCVRKPFASNTDIIYGCMQHGTINLNRVSGYSQLDQPDYIDHKGKCVATEPDTSSCNLHDRSARRSRAQVQRSRDGASGASTATKCSLAQKRPCGILTGLLTSGGLEFGKCYSLPALSGPSIKICHYDESERVALMEEDLHKFLINVGYVA